MNSDLVLVDISLPQMNGAELIAIIRDRWPHLPCLVLSGHGETTYIERARNAGARGYLLKGTPYELPEAVRRILAGAEYFAKSAP